MSWAADHIQLESAMARQYEVWQEQAEVLVAANSVKVATVSLDERSIDITLESSAGLGELYFSYPASSPEYQELKDVMSGMLLTPKLLHPSKDTGEASSLRSFVSFSIKDPPV